MTGLTISGTTTPPSTYSMGCCEHLTHFLGKIKRVALCFFQWLFCCPSAQPKPLEQVTQFSTSSTSLPLLPQNVASSSNSSSSASSSSISSTLSSTTPRYPDEGQAIANDYYNALSQVKKDQRLAVFTNTGVFLLRYLNALDQLWILQKCSTCLVIADWTDFIQALPEHIKNQIDPKNPQFEALYNKQKSIPTAEPSQEKLFLHSRLHNIFAPRDQVQLMVFSYEEVQKFQGFSPQEQFFILYTLFAIGMQDDLKTNLIPFSDVRCLLKHFYFKDRFEIERIEPIGNQTQIDELFVYGRDKLARDFSVMEKIKGEHPDWLSVNPLPASTPPQPLTTAPAAPTAPVKLVNPPKAARIVVMELFQHFAQLRKQKKMSSNSVEADVLYPLIINALAKQIDQLFLLRKLMQDNKKRSFINRWNDVTNGLSQELRLLIEGELEKVKGIEEISSFVLHAQKSRPERVWVMDSLRNVLDTLITKPQVEAPNAPYKECLQEMVFYICSPASDTQAMPHADHLKLFSSFKKQEQAEILLFLINIAQSMENLKLTKLFNIDFLFINSLWKQMRQTMEIHEPEKIPNDVATTDLLARLKLHDLLIQVMQAQ